MWQLSYLIKPASPVDKCMRAGEVARGVELERVAQVLCCSDGSDYLSPEHIIAHKFGEGDDSEGLTSASRIISARRHDPVEPVLHISDTWLSRQPDCLAKMKFSMLLEIWRVRSQPN